MMLAKCLTAAALAILAMGCSSSPSVAGLCSSFCSEYASCSSSIPMFCSTGVEPACESACSQASGGLGQSESSFDSCASCALSSADAGQVCSESDLQTVASVACTNSCSSTSQSSADQFFSSFSSTFASALSSGQCTDTGEKDWGPGDFGPASWTFTRTACCWAFSTLLSSPGVALPPGSYTAGVRGLTGSSNDSSIDVTVSVSAGGNVALPSQRFELDATPSAISMPFQLTTLTSGVSIHISMDGANREGGDPADANANLTLPEALQYAHAHQPSLRAAAARVDVLRADGAVARSRWYPTLLGTAQLLATTTNNTTGSYVSVPGFDNPRVSATRAESPTTASLNPSASTLVGIGLRQEIFDFGRISAEAAADDLRADAERYTVESATVGLDYDIEESYFAVHAAHSVLDASQKAYERAVVHRDEAKAGVDSGMRRPIELTRAEATLDRYDLGRIRARKGLAIAQSVLAAAVGLPGQRLDVSGPPPERPVPPSMDAALADARGHNPDLLAVRARVRAQESETHAIGSQLRPNLFATAGISGNAGGASPTSGSAAPESGLLPVVPNWDVGVVLAWPLYDATVDARQDRSRAIEGAVRDESDVVDQKVAAAVEQAYVDLEAARDSLPVLEHATQAAVANYDQANHRFEEGMSNAVELADAEQVRIDAEIELALGTFDVARARASLARAVGGLP
jgi:outer membrane protein TolC